MFRRHLRKNGDWVPERPTHQAESPEVQMRIIRTHIAAQATELSNVTQQLREIRSLLDQICDEYLGEDR